MERLGWVEILDRHGDAIGRHPVYAWPLRVGRAYDNDVILDDPYVSANHLEIDRGDDGTYHFRVIDSINAMTIDKLRDKKSEASVPANEVVRIGQTQLRIRPVNYAVPAEKALPNGAWMRSWSGLAIGLTTLLLVQLVTLWLNYNRADSYNIIVTPILGMFLVLLLWSGFWALIGRVASGRANFIAHAVNASLCFALILFLNGLAYGYVDFAFDTDLMIRLSTVMGALIIGTLIYRHMRLVSRLSRRMLVTIIAALIVSFIGFGYISDIWNADEHLTDMDFPGSIGPPYLSLMKGKSTEAFIGEADKLKARVDELRHES
jgi:hypothetical protein